MALLAPYFARLACMIGSYRIDRGDFMNQCPPATGQGDRPWPHIHPDRRHQGLVELEPAALSGADAPPARHSRSGHPAAPDRAPTTREQILQHSPRGQGAGAEDRGGRHDDGVGQPGDLRDPGRAPSRSRLWPDDAAARAGRAPMPRKCIPAFPICATSLRWISPATLPLPELRAETQGPDRAHHRGLGERRWRSMAERRLPVRHISRSPTACMRRWCRALPPMAWTFPSRCKAYMERIWALPAMQNWLKASQKEVADGLRLT